MVKSSFDFGVNYPFEYAFLRRRFPRHPPQRFDPPLIRTPKFGQSLIEIRECEIKIITQIAELEIKFSDR
jgi:hypothetical protein